MMNGLKTWARGLWWRIRGQGAYPVIVERVRTSGTADSSSRTGSHQDHAGHDQRSSHINPVEAAEVIFAPSHGEEDSFQFTHVAADGSIPNQGEVWDRERDAMRVRRRKFLMVTCSRSVVRSPEEISCICTECNGADINSVRCIVCGAILCQIHARVLEHPTGPAIYCRQHLNEALDNWDTWAAYDANNGKQPQRNNYDGRPYAIARYSQNGGSQHAE